MGSRYLLVCATLALAAHSAYSRVEMNVNYIIDTELAIARQSILADGYDPYKLPSDSSSFQIKLFNHTFNATVWLGEGELKGIGTVHRTADTFMNITSLSPLAGQINGSAALTGPDVFYYAGIDLGPLKEKAGIEFHIPLLQLDFHATIDASKLNETKIEKCGISHFIDPRIDLSGIGLLETPVFNLLINTLTNYFHDIVQSEVSKIGCKLIEKLLPGLTAAKLLTAYPRELAVLYTEAYMEH